MSARSLNKVLLIGNLTRDPELRYTPAGTAVCTFGLATNREWVDASGQKQEGAEFHKIVAWTKLAEICSQLLFKGRKAYVSGRLQTRNWQGQDGAERTTTEIVIDEMIAFGEGKGGGQPMDESYVPEASADEAARVFTSEEVSAEEPKKAKKTKSKAEEVADDIPF
ncbi:MAG: single-stranded DNA-binding protein [Patescibacteria group bacterium]|mgnify:FL=1